MTDVLVVGASVAGSTTALYLARRGYEVKLIDRSMFPRRKACGEGIFPAGMRVLDDLGVLGELRSQAAPLASLSFIGYGATASTQFSPTAAGTGLGREVLDAALLNQARREGVDVTLGVTATGLICDAQTTRFAGVMTSHGELRAKVIVAADGLGSRLRRAAGLNRTLGVRRYGVSAHYDMKEAPDFGIEVYFQPGYEVYLTPVGGCVVNVAVLLGSDMARKLGGGLENTFDELAARSSARLRDVRRVDKPLVAGPFPAGAKQRWTRNLLLVGDAAGFFDGITGEGMSLALSAAKKCAEAVHAFLLDGRPSHFATYDRTCSALERPSTLMARLCLALAARPALGRRAIANMARKPAVLAKLVRVSQGEARLSSLRPADALALCCGI